MFYYEQAKKLNILANNAVSSGNFAFAYRLKIRAAKNALYCYEQTGDNRWIKLANSLFDEARSIKKRILSKTRTVSIVSENRDRNILERIEMEFVVEPKISLQDIGGLESSKRILREALEWPLKFPEKMKEYGLDYVLSGVFVYGPPGCGKTLLVEGIAKDLNIKLLEASPSAITSKWFGESEKFVKRLFQIGRENRPSIIFIDEIDKFLPQSTNSSVIPRILSVFQTEMDGLGTHDKNQMIVVMASNEPWKINRAILRPGRCDRIIYIPPPDRDTRKAIFKIHSQTRRLGDDIDVNSLSDLTAPKEEWHYSGSDIANICRTAKKQGMRKSIKREANQQVDMKCFMKALKIVRPSISPRILKKYDEWAEKHASFKD